MLSVLVQKMMLIIHIYTSQIYIKCVFDSKISGDTDPRFLADQLRPEQIPSAIQCDVCCVSASLANAMRDSE